MTAPFAPRVALDSVGRELHAYDKVLCPEYAEAGEVTCVMLFDATDPTEAVVWVLWPEAKAESEEISGDLLLVDEGGR